MAVSMQSHFTAQRQDIMRGMKWYYKEHLAVGAQ
jgi:hypothetical protein